MAEMNLSAARGSAIVSGLGPVALIVFAVSNRDPFIYAAFLFIGITVVLISTCLGLVALIKRPKIKGKILWITFLCNVLTVLVIALGVPFL